MSLKYADDHSACCPKCGASPLRGDGDDTLVTCPNGHSFTPDELNTIAAEPESGTVKEIAQDLDPAATPEQLAAWAKKDAVDAFVAANLPPAAKRFSVTLAGHGTLLIDASDEAAAKAEYNRQIGVKSSVHAYTVKPVLEG